MHLTKEAYFKPILNKKEMEQQSPDPSDDNDADEQIRLDEELIYIVRSKNIQERDKVEKIKSLIMNRVNINFKDANDKNNTALHIAVREKEIRVIETLVKNGANINAQNIENKSPLDIAKHLERPDIIEILESSIQNKDSIGEASVLFQENSCSESTKNQNYNAQSLDHSREHKPKQSQGKIKYEKRPGTAAGIGGYFYEIDLLTLAKLRGENDVAKFYLASNLKGLGAFDDLVIRYWTSDDKNKSKIILLQAKHVHNPKKRKITIQKFKKKNDEKFYLGKYLLSYLKSRVKFNKKQTDPVFKGNFRELDPKYIIYTNSILHEEFDKSRKDENVESNIFSTGPGKGEAFKFCSNIENDDLINELKSSICEERIKTLAEVLVSFFCDKLNYNNMMENELFLTYHVYLSTNIFEIMEEKKKDINGIEYREAKINHNFLGKSKTNPLIKEVLNQCEKCIKDECAKEFMEELKNRVDDISDFEVIAKALKEQVEKNPLKISVDFGNISPNYKDDLIEILIKLYKEDKSQKVIKIDDDMVDNGKILTHGDIKKIGNLVGNLLVFDQKDEMLRLVNEECLNRNALELIQKLKRKAYSVGLEPDDYRFDIKVKTFPRDYLFNDNEDRVNVEEFLRRLEIFTGQASDAELKKIIKGEIKDFCKITNDEVEDMFLKIKDKATEVWGKDEYSVKEDDFFSNILKTIQFDVTEPAFLFTGRNEELNKLHEILQDKNKVALITGLGGVGKSELAKKYIMEYSKSYSGGLIWIDAKSYHSLTESFYILARDKLEINVIIDGKIKKDIKVIVQDVYRVFDRRTNVFVFDDVKEYSDVKDFLPRSFANKKTQILITSCNRNWEIEDHEAEAITLEKFNPDEAEKFVEDYLAIKNDTYKNYVVELTKQLEYYPLGLRQAVAYIKQVNKTFKKRGNEKYDIGNYLKERQSQKNKLPITVYDENSATKTVLTVWITTLERIGNQKYGKQAIDFLNIMAYFAPNEINIRDLFSMLETDDKRWNAVELLDKYSMINLKKGVVNIHSLVQEVTRQKLNRGNKEKKVLTKALNEIDNVNISEKSISHVIFIWTYVSKYPELIDEFGFKSVYGNAEDTVVHLMVSSGNEEEMSRILKVLPQLKDMCNKYGETPLYEAITNDYIGIVKKLIEVHNVDPNNNISANGHKPITLAAFLGKKDLVEYLVSKGANVNSHIKNSFSVLDMAALSGNKSLVEYLISEGAKTSTNSDYGSVLHNALYSSRFYNTCENDIFEIIKLCLQEDKDLIKIVGVLGKTPLHLAVELGFTKIVEMLLSKDVDVNVKTRKSTSTTITDTKINLTVEKINGYEYLSITETSSGTTIMTFDNVNGYDKGYTALHIAAKENRSKIVEMLLRKGSHYDIKNEEGMTPLKLAQAESDVKKLLSCITNLFKAVSNGNIEKVDSLLKEKNHYVRDIILNTKNTDKNKLVVVAGKKGQRSTAVLLLKYLKNIEEVNQSEIE